MGEPEEGKTQTPTPTPENGKGDGGQTQDGGKTYDQAAVDDLLNKVRATERKKVDALSNKLKQLEDANKTEAEKAISEAEKRGADTVRAEMAAKEKAWKLGAKLTSMGLDPTQAEDIARLADPDTEDVNEAAEALRGRFPGLFATKTATTAPVGSDGPPQKSDSDWSKYADAAVLQEAIQANGRDWYLSNRDKILKAQREAGVRLYKRG